MKFTDKGNTKVIEFEETDTEAEKRIVEQGIAFLAALLRLIMEVE